MSEFQEVMKKFDRMCRYYQRNLKCPMACPMNGVNISQCRKIAFEQPDVTEKTVMSWTEPVFPTWGEWLKGFGLIEHFGDRYGWGVSRAIDEPIPADIAEKLGIEPKEG